MNEPAGTAPYQSNQDQEPLESHSSILNLNKYWPLLLISSLIVVALGSYYLGTQKSYKDNKTTYSTPNTPSQILPTETNLVPSSTPMPTQQAQNGKIAFEGTKAGYRLEYPASWKATSEYVRGYEFVTIESPDFQISNEYPVLEKRFSFSVDVNDSDLNTIDDYFNNDTLTKSIARNKIKTTVGSIEAIQYDFGYETHTATQTEFLKGGKRYTIQYRYVDTNSKQTEWNTYEELLKSFRVN